VRGFASDNYAPVHPDVLAELARVNDGHAKAYGYDDVTIELQGLFKDHFGSQAEAFVVFNGTGANVVSLQLLLRPWESVICASTAHINVDEGGAPEHYLGTKLVDVPAEHGKLTPELVRLAWQRVGDEHATQPRVVSITQSTELGTRYSAAEIGALSDTAHGLGGYLHVDGARISNAAAGLGVDFKEFTTDAGVDVLSFGGTKNGLMGAEAVLVLNPEIHAKSVLNIRKQAMQLSSKQRYMSAQLVALLRDGLWHRLASHSNAMAQRLALAVGDIPGVTLTHPVQANGVFAIIPGEAIAPLQASYPFYEWDENTHEVRWMCSWDTTEADIDAFAALVRSTVVG
jgi:threonine aldolase